MMGMASGPLTTSLVTSYLLLCLLAVGAMVVVAAAVWRSRASATGRAALAAVGCVLGWLLAVILALVSPTASLAIFWHQTVRFVFVVLSTPLLICFIAAYFGTPRLSRWLPLSLFVIPGLTILLDLTNSLHHLFLASYAMLRVGPYFVRSAWVPGPWFPVYAVFSSASLTMTVVAVVLAFRRRPPLYRAQVRMFVLSLLPPSALLLFDTLSRAPLAMLGTAPLGFAAMALLQAWMLLHQRLFDLVPVAREAMFASMDDPVLALDRHGRIVDLNPAAERVLGLPADQVLGAELERLLPVNLGDLQAATDAASGANGRVNAVNETNVQTPHGFPLTLGSGERRSATRFYDVRVSPLVLSLGHVDGQLLVLRDITALKQAEARVAEQASQLEAIFEAQADGVGVFDRQRRLVRANRAWQAILQQYADITGLSADPAFAALSLADQVDRLTLWDEHGQVIPREQRPTSRALQGETVTGASAIDEWVHDPTGQAAVVFSVSAAPVRDPTGQIMGAVTIVRDVTERRQLVARLAEQERQFRTLVEHSPDIIARFDRDLRYLYINPAIGTVSPLPPQAFIGKTNAELGFPESLYDSAHRAIAQVFATGQGCTIDVPDAEPTMDSPDAHTFLARIVPECDVDGAVASVLTITTEITERKRAEVALREAKAAAERAHQEEEHRREEAERREAIAASLRDVLRILNSKRSLQEVLHIIAQQAGRLLGSAATTIYGTDDGLAAGLAENTADGTVMPTVGGLAMEDLAARQVARQIRTTSRQQMPAAPTGLDAAGALEEPATAVTTDMVERLTLQAAAGILLLSWADQTPSCPPARLQFAHAAVRHALTTQSPVAVLNGCGLPAQSDAMESVESKEGAESGVDRAATQIALPKQFEGLPSPYQALLVVPITVHEEVYGCLLLFYTMRWQFASGDVALARAYADQIALAIANARLQTHIAQAATEAERARLAGDLHDTVTQELFSANILAQALPQLWEQHRAEAEAALGQLHAITQSGLAALRLLLLELRPGGLEEMTLPVLVQQLLEAMRTRAGVPLRMETAGTEDMGDWMWLAQDVKQAFYRMAQEAVTNAVKYAAANQIVVRLHREQQGDVLCMEVEDDGVGFDPRISTPGHFGLAMMHERAQGVGASVQVGSQLGQGTRVVVRWRPLQKGYREASAASAVVAIEQEKGDAHD